MLLIFWNGCKKGAHNFSSCILAFINFILLGTVYFLGVGVTSIVARITRKKFIELDPDPKRISYWRNVKSNDKRTKEEYYRQF